MEVADPLLRSGELEEGMVGNQIVGAMVRHIGGNEFDRFDDWVGALTSEINTDGLASHLISRAVAGKPSLVKRLLEWTTSPSPWRRRAAVLAFSPMIREGRFITDAFSVAEKLLNDPEETVQRGVGMLFIEASRLQADRVFEFLEPHKGDCAKLVLSTASQKLSQAQRSALLGS
jgi:3-methyladenine DNA glycosylase AlkD